MVDPCLDQVTVLKAIDEHLRLMKRLIGKQYEKPTLIKFTNTRLRIQQFIKYKFKRGDIYLYELNDAFMEDFETFLREKFENSTTTCYKHFQRFSHMIKKAVNRRYPDKYLFPEYRIRMPRKRIQYLDREELSRIENLQMVRDFSNFLQRIQQNRQVTNLTPAECPIHSPGRKNFLTS